MRGYDLIAVVPITRTNRRNILHVAILAPEGGLTANSFALCDQVRSVSTRRLGRYYGRLTDRSMELIADAISIFLDL
jgi:mRNA interferase MazF